MAGALAAILLVCAVAFEGARDELSALAICAGVLWLGLDALASKRSPTQARLVMAGALAVLIAIPAVMLAFSPDLWNGASHPVYAGGLALWAVAVFALVLGTQAAGRRSVAPRPVQPSVPAGRRAVAIVTGLVLVSLALFTWRVGGPREFYSHLDSSGATTKGLTYLIWGILFAKYASFVAITEDWTAGRRPSWRTWALVGLGLASAGLIGSRLLLLVAALQLILLYAASRPTGPRFRAILVATGIAAVLMSVLLGEVRRWRSIGEGQSFSTYLSDRGLPMLKRTYVNQYADGVRIAVLANEIVPRATGYEYGREFARVILHPLPSQVRPELRAARPLRDTFNGTNGSGNALPLPVVGYIQFGLIGAVLLSFALGWLLGWLDRVTPAARDVGWLAAGIATSTGAVMVMRGTLAQALALALIDVIGFFAAHRLLFRRRPETTEA